MDYEQFRKEYELMHPASVPVAPQVGKVNVWMRVGISAMFICAAMLSGVHTVPTVRAGIEVNELITPTVRDFVALSSFIAVELAILIAGYGVSKNRWVSWLTTGAAFVVAVVANITSVSRALDGGDTGTIIVAVVLGGFAPLMALLAGIALLSQREELKADTSERWHQYRLELRAFDQRVNAEWGKHQAKQRPPELSETSGQADRTTHGVQPSGVRADMDKRPSRAGYGFDRTSDAQQKAIDWFNANPEQANLPVRALEGLIGVSKSTVGDARKVWLGQKQLTESSSTNGHAEAQS